MRGFFRAKSGEDIFGLVGEAEGWHHAPPVGHRPHPSRTSVIDDGLVLAAREPDVIRGGYTGRPPSNVKCLRGSIGPWGERIQGAGGGYGWDRTTDLSIMSAAL